MAAPDGPRRRTINDPTTFVCSQFWEAADGSIWWDLKYLFIYLKNNQWVESYLTKFAKWEKNFEKQSQSVPGLPAARPRPEVFDGIPNPRQVSDTLALVSYLFVTADKTRDPEKSTALIGFIRKMVAKASKSEYII